MQNAVVDPMVVELQAFVGLLAEQQLPQNDAKRPDVNLFRILLVSNHLRRPENESFD